MDRKKSNLEIIYEDNHLIAVKKPFNLLTQSDKTREQSLYDQVKNYLKEKYHKPGNVYLGLLHRLDRPVSGIILFAKTSKAASRLSKQFRERMIIKKYLAIVEGKMPIGENKTLINYLSKNSKTNKVKITDQPHPNSKKAILQYVILPSTTLNLHQFTLGPKKIKQLTNCSLLEIDLKTGLPHQIRAQLSFIGHPIIGDIKYQAQYPLPQKNIALISNQLSFYHPTTKKLISLKINS